MVVGLPHSACRSLDANHFVLHLWQHICSERQMKAFHKLGKVSGKEMNASESLMKHRYQIEVASKP